MSIITKPNKDSKTNLINLSLIVVFIVLLTLFCKAMQYSLIIPLLLFFFGVHLNLVGYRGHKMLLHLGLLLTLVVFASHTFVTYSDSPLFYFPVATVPLLTMLLFNRLQLSFIMAIASSILVTLIFEGGFGMMLTFFIGGLTGAYFVRDARTRGQLFMTGLFVSLMQVTCVILLYPNIGHLFSQNFAVHHFLPVAMNGFVAVFVVIASLKVFESLFGVLTNFSLLELSDFNQPLLKRMILEAPGTYHHSLVVSNLAEAAADAIGANALLTRVGAYYHDIGKMNKPEYFTENQLVGGNKHDHIEPSMSRLVILNHVKEGIELAKKHKLNQAIIDFIPQHHGTSVIYYFHQKALEAAQDGEEISEDIYRYPGPKPQSRETAITLLADSVEGATRALDDPNANRIEETVKKVVNNKFIDGQLDECPLTLKEIDRISSTFIRVLSAMYHGRVKYPEKKNGTKANVKKDGHQNRKSAEKATPQDSPDQKADPGHSSN